MFEEHEIYLNGILITLENVHSRDITGLWEIKINGQLIESCYVNKGFIEGVLLKYKDNKLIKKDYYERN